IINTRSYETILSACVDLIVEGSAAKQRVDDAYTYNTVVRDELRMHDGRTIERYSAPVRLPDGRPVGRVTFFEDITAERTAHLEAGSARAAAEAASNAKSMFLANMSHELRTPLNAVIGLTDLLLIESGDPVTRRQREYLEAIVQSGRHLLALVND